MKFNWYIGFCLWKRSGPYFSQLEKISDNLPEDIGAIISYKNDTFLDRVVNDSKAILNTLLKGFNYENMLKQNEIFQNNLNDFITRILCRKALLFGIRFKKTSAELISEWLEGILENVNLSKRIAKEHPLEKKRK